MMLGTEVRPFARAINTVDHRVMASGPNEYFGCVGFNISSPAAGDVVQVLECLSTMQELLCLILIIT